jgi:hypothetical protein
VIDRKAQGRNAGERPLEYFAAQVLARNYAARVYCCQYYY